MTNELLSLEFQKFTEEDWLKRMYRKSESKRTEQTAKTSLNMFELFCQSQNYTKQQVIQTYQALFNQEKPNIQAICMSLDKFIQFLNEDQDIEMNRFGPKLFKKKSPKTIKNYFSFIKSYLRLCHGVKLTVEDIKDFVTFPKTRKEPRKPISIETLKIILHNADPRRRALYYVLVSSGMRISEALSLTKKNFHFDENPLRISLMADDTKTKEGRETFITSEAYERIKPLLENKRDDELIFTHHKEIDAAVRIEEQYFGNLRKALSIKYSFLAKRYPNSTRFETNIHAMRSYFHTKASQKHGSEYANALDGHGAYLKEYYRLDPKDRARKYKELEPSLLIESFHVESETTKDKIIADMQRKMQEMEEVMIRQGLLK